MKPSLILQIELIVPPLCPIYTEFIMNSHICHFFLIDFSLSLPIDVELVKTTIDYTYIPNN